MKQTHLPLALLLASLTLALPSHAQPSVPAPESQQVNPMTGRPLSEEALTRNLSRAKLETQIQQETVKQSQQRSDLALALLRQNAEEYRLRQETGIGANKPPTIIAVPAVRPSPKPPAASRTPPEPVVVASTPPARPAAPTVRVAGSVTIGGESAQILSAYMGAPATIESVDPQKSATSADGRPMFAPRNFGPLDIAPIPGGIPAGVPGMGIPAIPGLAPAAR
jgi:hypothetical protein